MGVDTVKLAPPAQQRLVHRFVGSIGAAEHQLAVELEPSPVVLDQSPEGALVASIIHVDRFGNCVTNITRQDLAEEAIKRGARLLVGGREIRSFRRFFADEGDRHSEPFAVWGSAGFLELAVFRDSAARVLGAGRGQKVEVKTV